MSAGIWIRASIPTVCSCEVQWELDIVGQRWKSAESETHKTVYNDYALLGQQIIKWPVSMDRNGTVHVLQAIRTTFPPHKTYEDPRVKVCRQRYGLRTTIGLQNRRYDVHNHSWLRYAHDRDVFEPAMHNFFVQSAFTKNQWYGVWMSIWTAWARYGSRTQRVHATIQHGYRHTWCRIAKHMRTQYRYTLDPIYGQPESMTLTR